MLSSLLSVSSSGVSEDRGQSDSTQTREEEGEEEKERKAADSASANYSGEPRASRYHGSDGGDPHPAAAKRTAASE